MVIYAGSLRIGVLGGIGPEASAEFYHRLIIRLQSTGLIKSNKDFPQIIINSIPAPELISSITPEQLSRYKFGLRQLDSLGVNVIVMVCNTIHLYVAELQKGICAPIMDLRMKVRQRLEKYKAKKVAVIGTPATINQGLYRFEGVEYIELADDEINSLSEAIFKYNKGENKDLQQQIVKNIARKCLDRGADAILAACTEIAAVLKDTDMPKIDTFEILVDSVIEFYQMTRLPLLIKNEFRR